MTNSKSQINFNNQNSKSLRFELLKFGAYLLFGICFLVLSAPIGVNAAATISLPMNNLGLVGYWNFNSGKGTDIAWDLSGNGNNGKLTSMDPATDWVVGKSGLGTALDFDGSNDYVDMGDTVEPTTAATFSAWFRLSSFGVEDLAIISKFISADRQYRLTIVNSTKILKVEVTNTAGSSDANRSSSSAVSIGVWYHVVVVFNGTAGTLNLYLDGVLNNGALGGTVPSQIRNGANTLKVGANANVNTFFNGLIDEVRIYNRALLATEIKRLYNLTAPKIATVPLSNGLVGYWDFNSGKGTDIAWDLSGNGNNGRLTSMDPATDWVVGKSGLGTALDFDGSNDYVQIPTQPFNYPECSIGSCITNNYNLTFSIWFRTSSSGGILGQTESASPPSAPNEYVPALYVDSGGNIRASFFWHGDYNQNTTSGTDYRDNKWHHATAMYTSGVERLYIDGVEVDSQTISQDPYGNNGYVYLLGAAYTNQWPSTNNSWYYFSGRLDEVRIYNRALSADEIKRLYNLTQPKIATVPISNGLVGYWDFNFGKGGAIAFDQSGNNSDGRLTSMDPATDWVMSKPRLGTALDFDASNDYVDVGSGTLLDNLGPVTISAWIYPRSEGENARSGILVKGDGNGPGIDGLGFRFGSTGDDGTDRTNALTLFVPSSGTDLHVVANDNTVTLNKWQHAVVTWDGSTSASGVHIYIDGVEVGYQKTQSAGGVQDDDNTVNMLLGIGVFGANSNTFDGKVDEVRIYDRVLSTDEIKRLYLLGL